jgi:hypothetical protein
MTKDNFISLLSALQKQHDKDIAYHEAQCKLYGTDDIPMYDNTLLTTQFIKQMQEAFPIRENGECDIERFIYTYDFGRHADSEFKTSLDLWNYLSAKKITHSIEFKTMFSFSKYPSKKKYDGGKATNAFLLDEIGHWPSSLKVEEPEFASKEDIEKIVFYLINELISKKNLSIKIDNDNN